MKRHTRSGRGRRLGFWNAYAAAVERALAGAGRDVLLAGVARAVRFVAGPAARLAPDPATTGVVSLPAYGLGGASM
jgi:hypothetical protein